MTVNASGCKILASTPFLSDSTLNSQHNTSLNSNLTAILTP